MGKFVLFLLLSAGIASAQVNKNLGDFDQIKVFDRIEVELIKADENRIELRGPRASDVEVVTKNNLLKIRMRATGMLGGEDIKATVYYKSINDIDASEGAQVSSEATLKLPNLTVTVKEGAQIELNLDIENLSIKSVTGGIVRLAGSAENMKANLGTGGILEAKPLMTKQANISINAGGEADIQPELGDGADILLGRSRIARREQAVHLAPRTDDEPDAGGHVAIQRSGLLPDRTLRRRRDGQDAQAQQRRAQQPETPHATSPL